MLSYVQTGFLALVFDLTKSWKVKKKRTAKKIEKIEKKCRRVNFFSKKNVEGSKFLFLEKKEKMAKGQKTSEKPRVLFLCNLNNGLLQQVRAI